MNDEITVSNNPDDNRYEVRVGSARAGFAQYRQPDEHHVDFVHTEVDDAYTGQGLASRLIAEAIADVQRQEKRVIPHCPFVAKWLTENPEYDEMVDWP